jgi:uncharacterized protein (DUF608 family)
MNRRDFTKTISAAGALSAIDGLLETRKLCWAATGLATDTGRGTQRLFPVNLAPNRWQEFSSPGFTEPVSGVVYKVADIRAFECGMPLGGIGTGCLDLNMDGRLGYCTVFRRVWGWDYRDRVYALSDTALKEQRRAGGATGATATPLKGGTVRDLPAQGRGPLQLPFLAVVLGSETYMLTTRPLDTVRRAKSISYWGHYPVADLEYELDSPVSVGVRAWSSFLPGDVDNSQIPGAVFDVRVRNLGPVGLKAAVVISFPGPARGSGERTWTREQRTHGSFRGSVMQGPDCGYALGVVGQEALRVGGALDENATAWTRAAKMLPEPVEQDSGASAAVDLVLGPGQQRTVRFILAWHTPEWQSEFPYGLKLNRYTNHYTRLYPSAIDAARKLADESNTLLERILAWQQVIYTEHDLPPWLRDQLINTLHLITEESFWATAKPPLGEWCYQGGLFSLVESTVAAGQQSCIPCDWYGNFPVVYFFPDLAWSTLRAFRVNMNREGAVPFYLGQGLDLAGGPNETNYAYERQQSQNGCCFADLVDRMWLATGNTDVLREFYPAVKKNTIYTMTVSQPPGPEGVLGVISEPGDEWYESMNMQGLTAHAGGTRLAQLRIAERMADILGDADFARQCREWFAQGSPLLEEKLWDGQNYLLSLDPVTGKKNDLVLAYQLDGEWIARFHGLEGVFRSDRVDITLGTIKRLNSSAPLNGVIDVIQKDGRPTEFGDRMGWMCSMPASALILAMTYIYAGHREEGLDLAYKCVDAVVNRFEMTWDIPNMVRSDPGAGQLQECMRIYGTDYYQFLSLWGLPAALKGHNLRQAAAPGELIARIVEAARGERSQV